MASNIKQLPDGGRIVFDWKAFDQIRKSAGIKSQIKSLGDSMAAAAGAGDFECNVFDMGTRSIAIVTNSTIDGAISEATDKVLTKAVRV